MHQDCEDRWKSAKAKYNDFHRFSNSFSSVAKTLNTKTIALMEKVRLLPEYSKKDQKTQGLSEKNYFRIKKSIFSVTTGMILSTNIFVENYKTLEEDSIANGCFFTSSCIKFVKVRNIKRMLVVLIFLVFRTQLFVLLPA